VDCDIVGITAKGSDILFHPFERKTLVSHGCVLVRQCSGFGESEYTQPVVHAYVNHRQAIVNGLNDQATRLVCQFIL